MIWHAIECSISPRKTLEVRDELKSMGYEAFTPVETVRKRIKGKKWGDVTVAAMPGYVFINFPGPIRWEALHNIDGYHDYVRAAGSYDTPASISDRAMRRVINMSSEELAKLRKGIMVNVREGCFAGFSGPLSMVKNDQVAVLVMIFGRSTEVKMPIDAVEAA